MREPEPRNRKERREQERKQRSLIADIPEWKRREMEKRIETTKRLMQQGISPKDLEDSYNRGVEDGRKEYVSRLAPYQMKFFYSAAGIAAHDLFGFGETRIIRLLDRIQEIMTEEISTGDIIERLKQETGLDIMDEDYTI